MHQKSHNFGTKVCELHEDIRHNVIISKVDRKKLFFKKYTHHNTKYAQNKYEGPVT